MCARKSSITAMSSTTSRAGAIFVEELSEVPEGARVIFSAHGVSPAVRAEAKERRLQVIDATCPLVTKVHLEAVRFAKQGYTIVLIGHRDHDEVIGTLGEALGKHDSRLGCCGCGPAAHSKTRNVSYT